MSLEAILAGIEADAVAQIEQMACEAQAQIQAILDDAQKEAAVRYEAARSAVLQPVAMEKARCVYEARLEAERLTAVAQGERMSRVQALAQQRLAQLRHNTPAYAGVLSGLIREAIYSLGQEEVPHLIIDPRDQALVERILDELSLDLPVESGLKSWGGVVAQSSDGRIVVTNTLESRLERVMAYVEL